MTSQALFEFIKAAVPDFVIRYLCKANNLVGAVEPIIKLIQKL